MGGCGSSRIGYRLSLFIYRGKPIPSYVVCSPTDFQFPTPYPVLYCSRVSMEMLPLVVLFILVTPTRLNWAQRPNRNFVVSASKSVQDVSAKWTVEGAMAS